MASLAVHLSQWKWKVKQCILHCGIQCVDCLQTCIDKIHITMHSIPAKSSMDICWCDHHIKPVQFEFIVTINPSSESFTEPNASHDPVGEGWVRPDRLQWFMQGKCMLGRHETHCGVACSLIHHVCAYNN